MSQIKVEAVLLMLTQFICPCKSQLCSYLINFPQIVNNTETQSYLTSSSLSEKGTDLLFLSKMLSPMHAE